MGVQGFQFLAYEWAWFAVMTFLVFARLYVRVYMIGNPLHKESWRWSDIFIFISFLLRIPLVVGDCFVNAWNGYRTDYIAYTSPSETIKLSKVNFWLQLVYMVVFILIKCAMLCLFAEFVPRILNRVWMYIHFIAFLVVGHGISSLVVYMTWCIPITSLWDNPHPSCSIPMIQFYVWFPGHIFTDLLIISIPFTIISLLRNLTMSQRIMGCAMFSLGFVAVACAFANCIVILKALNGTTLPTEQQWTAIDFTSITEPPLAICIACIPPLRLLLTKSGRKQLFGDRNGTQDSAATAVESGIADMEGSNVTKSSMTKDDEEMGMSSKPQLDVKVGQRITDM